MFSKNRAPSLFSIYAPLTSCQKLERLLEPLLRTGRYGRTNEHEFIGPFSTSWGTNNNGNNNGNNNANNNGIGNNNGNGNNNTHDRSPTLLEIEICQNQNLRNVDGQKGENFSKFFFSFSCSE